MTQIPPHRFAVAPMMKWTDRHCRYFHRQLSRHALLYTEMLTAEAVLRGARERLLAYEPAEHPVALQLGGADPSTLAEAARIGADYGYDEINLNVGCPSDRVQSGRFGACLMAEPELVAACVAAMASTVDVPVTVKCRIGIDEQDIEADLDRFIDVISAAGCTRFIVHARQAWLQGLSPKDNREVPPLDYGRVRRLKARRPDLTIVLNGGLGSLDEAVAESETLDGVMLGRAAYQCPYVLAEVDCRVFDADEDVVSREDVLDAMIAYAAHHIETGGRLFNVVRHMLGLYHGQPRARAFRRYLSENAIAADAGVAVLETARELVTGRFTAAGSSGSRLTPAA